MRFTAKYLLAGFVFFSVAAAAGDQLPTCPARGQDLAVNNEQVLMWKKSTPNQYLSRAHIQGRVVKVYSDKSGHDHFSVQIGTHAEDTVEVIYNQSFGAIPDVRDGMITEACGDYITSNKQAGHYPPSPDGAIVHWVHYNPGNRDKIHESGYLALDGKVYGLSDPQDSKLEDTRKERKKKDRRPRR